MDPSVNPNGGVKPTLPFRREEYIDVIVVYTGEIMSIKYIRHVDIYGICAIS